MSRPQAGSSSSSSRSCSFSCIFVYIQCLAIALLGAYPFVVVITRKMDNSDFVPCSDEAACTFIRYFGVADLPATTGWTIEQSHGTIKQQIHWSSWLPHWLPHYVAIRNGGKVQAVPPSISPSTIAPLCLLVYSCCTECCCDKEGGISEFRECHARLLSGQARADSQSLGRGLFALGLPYRCHHVVSPQNSARLGFVVSNHA